MASRTWRTGATCASIGRRRPGEVEVTTYDLEAFEQGKPAPELQRNDVIVVGKYAGKAFFYGFIDFFKGALGVAKGI